MKYATIGIILIVLIAGAVYALVNDAVPFRNSVSFGDEATLTLGKSVHVEGILPNAKRANIELLDVVSDNRCPSDVECITAGDAVFAFRFSLNDFEEIFELGEHNETFARAGIAVAIVAVEPTPISTQTITQERYRVTLQTSEARIDAFNDCVALEGMVLDSFPRACQVEGKTFVEEMNSDRSIYVATPQPDATFANLIDIHGEARTVWFSDEGHFPITLVALNGEEIAVGSAQVRGDFNLQAPHEFVTFVTSIPFDVAEETEAELIFKQNNSGSEEFRVPIVLQPKATIPQPGDVEGGKTIVLANQGGGMEGHTPRGFLGSGTGLFAGDNLNPRFPRNDGVKIFTSFDLSLLPKDANIVRATLSSSHAHISGSPYEDLGDLEVYRSEYDNFSSDLWENETNGFVCVFAKSQAGPFSCDVTETLQTIITNESPWAQFVFQFEEISDGDGAQDLAMFYITDSNTNEPGIFELSVTIVE